MSDFFSRLAARSLNLAPRLEPRLPSRFESPGWEEHHLAWENSLESEALFPPTTAPPGGEPDRGPPPAEFFPPAGESRENPLGPFPTLSPTPTASPAGDVTRQRGVEPGMAEAKLGPVQPVTPAPQSPFPEGDTAPAGAAWPPTPAERPAEAPAVLVAAAPGERPQPPPDRRRPQPPEQRGMDSRREVAAAAPSPVAGSPDPHSGSEAPPEVAAPGSPRVIRPAAPPVPAAPVSAVPVPAVPESPASASREAAEGVTPPPPTITVSIGRIEIKAIPAAAAPAPPPRKPPALMTLDDYLRQRHRGENR